MARLDGSALAHFVLRGEKLGVEGWRSVGRGAGTYCNVGLQQRGGDGGREALEVEVCCAAAVRA